MKRRVRGFLYVLLTADAVALQVFQVWFLFLETLGVPWSPPGRLARAMPPLSGMALIEQRFTTDTRRVRGFSLYLQRASGTTGGVLSAELLARRGDGRWRPVERWTKPLGEVEEGGRLFFDIHGLPDARRFLLRVRLAGESSSPGPSLLLNPSPLPGGGTMSLDGQEQWASLALTFRSDETRFSRASGAMPALLRRPLAAIMLLLAWNAGLVLLATRIVRFAGMTPRVTGP